MSHTWIFELMRLGDEFQFPSDLELEAEFNMDKVMVQINYTLRMSVEAYRNLVTPLAEPIAAVDGLLWKLWLIDEANHTAGCICLFKNTAAAQAYLGGPIVAQLGQDLQLTDIAVKTSRIDAELSAITRGPIESASA